MVIPQVLDENQSLCLILPRFLHVFSEGSGLENTVAMVSYKISSKIVSIHREKPIHSYLSTTMSFNTSNTNSKFCIFVLIFSASQCSSLLGLFRTISDDAMIISKKLSFISDIVLTLLDHLFRFCFLERCPIRQ